MTTYDNLSIFGGRRLPDFRITSVFKVISTWANRSQQRYCLRDLDDQMLRDIGVTRAEAVKESMKPFWRS